MARAEAAPPSTLGIVLLTGCTSENTDRNLAQTGETGACSRAGPRGSQRRKHRRGDLRWGQRSGTQPVVTGHQGKGALGISLRRQRELERLQQGRAGQVGGVGDVQRGAAHVQRPWEGEAE